jgi:ATP-dependent DNA ligase
VPNSLRVLFFFMFDQSAFRSPRCFSTLLRRTISSVSASPPKFVRPRAPFTRKSVPKGATWLHELKLDGYRFQIVKDGRLVRLYSRDGYDWTKRLPGFADAFQRLPCRSAVLDGELVQPDDDGAPDFDGLRTAVRETEEHEHVFFAFDLLYRDGKDLRALMPARHRERSEQSRRLESPPPMELAVGATGHLSCTAEMEIRISWIANWPPQS